jgi:glutamate synthase (NADPH/NADH) small chain
MPVNELAPALSAEELAERFADIAPPLGVDAARAEADRCLFCYDAPCTLGCPTHIDVPAFIKKISTNNLRGSARVILDANPFGHSCARACPVEVLCEGACVLNARGEKPINIALLQRHATDYVLEHKIRLFEPGPDNGKRVAIVGAGPAGLSCARELRRMGYQIVCFEAKDHPGGLNTYGIAEYKMTPDTALAEVADIVNLGVTLRTGTAVGRDIPFEDLLEDYDAVFIGVGLEGARKLGIPNEEVDGVIDALTFIADLKMRPYTASRVGRRVVVVGAGNTAIDAVTQAKRLGAEQAMIVYRRGEADMPCYDYEYQLAQNDGCQFRFHARPLAVVGESHVEGLEVETSDGSEVIPCDMIIRAIGQHQLPGFEIPDDHPKVYLGGDFSSGGAEIVNAAAEGMAAARKIDEMLEGGGTAGL